MEKACFTGDWGGVEAGAHTGSLLVVSRFSSIEWWKYSATPDQTNERGRMCHTIHTGAARQQLGLPSMTHHLSLRKS